MSETVPEDNSDFSDDGKPEKIYAPNHYQWAKSGDVHGANKESTLSHVRLDNAGDIYDFSHIHDTQPCTPLLNKGGRGNTIYGQAVRCTCPHVTPLYTRRPSKGGADAATIETDGVVGPTTARVGSHYFVLDPDVIADQRGARPLQLKTFGPSRGKSQDLLSGEETYPMCTIKQYKNPAPDKPPHPVMAPVPVPAPGPAPGAQILSGPSAACPHGPQRHLAEKSEDVENNENELRNVEPTVQR